MGLHWASKASCWFFNGPYGSHTESGVVRLSSFLVPVVMGGEEQKLGAGTDMGVSQN